MMKQQHITIRQKDKQDDVGAKLQEQSIKEVQQLAGEIWTDYNEHDPGVTTLEVLNYSLLELDYRLQFDLEDYLNSHDNPFYPSFCNLFLPEDVFTVSPVTGRDYRKLFLSAVKDVVNVWAVPHPEQGTYDFVLDVSPQTSGKRRLKIEQEVLRLYHAHRNLCENIADIHFLEHKNISLHVTIDVMTEHIDLEDLIADLYIQIQEFLAAGVRFRKLDDLLSDGFAMDEILDGPRQKKMVIDDKSLHSRKREYNFLQLYRQIQEIPGIQEISSLSLVIEGMELEEYINMQPDYNENVSYVIQFSAEENEKNIILRKKGRSIQANWKQVESLYHIKRLQLYGEQNHTADRKVLNDYPQGVCRNLFDHYALKNNLPSCYATANRLHEYLAVFDNQLIEILDELKNIPSVLSLNEHKFPDKKKEQWMNMLDCMYGETSDLAFQKDAEEESENLLCRSKFLRDIPYWGYERGRAFNIRENNGPGGLERYMKSILFSERHELEVYVLEHNLYVPDAGPNPFTLSVVLSATDSCIQDNGFINSCEQLLLSRIPAHIITKIYWIDKSKVKTFKADYTFWRYLVSTEKKTGLEELSKKIEYSLINDKY